MIVAKIPRGIGAKIGVKEIFEDFAEGKGNHLAVVKIGNTGVTYKPLDKVIINYFDSNAENLAQKINRCMAMEYNTPDKKAHIYIVSSDELVELKWLQKALEFLVKKAEIEFDVTENDKSIWLSEIISRCHTNGEKYAGYYFRPRPTTVFKTAQKFKTVKVY